VGVCNYFCSSTWPSPSADFTVYLPLQDGEGEGILKLVVTHAETETEIYRFQRWFAWHAGIATVHMPMRLSRCSFPAPGRYIFALHLDDAIIAQRFLDVQDQRGST
jgi:hypothetical protein